MWLTASGGLSVSWEGRQVGAWRWDCLVQTSYLGGEEVEGASQSRGHVIGKGGPE